MTDSLEKSLHKTLEPVDPGEQFVSRVLARLSDQPAVLEARVPPRRVWRWIPFALAASLVAAVLVRHELQLREEVERGRVAREQLLEALRVTSEKLDVAYRAVHPARETEPKANPDPII
ncbi:MAG TPA: hypothetical protein VK629_08275 [Steroidobacteraceae bacterium]|nr:hypothetical protein [Steroidobacteraceae bacterium]